MSRPTTTTTLRLAVSQSHTLPTLPLTLAALATTARSARASGIDLLLFPEAYLGGYPRGATFGTRVGQRDEAGREQFLAYWRGAVDLGDTPEGAAGWWVRREWQGGKGRRRHAEGRTLGGGGAVDGGGEEEGEDEVVRGDGTREELERVARETGVFLVVGVVEKAGGTLYCAVVYVCPKLGVIGKRRKVMPTGTERLVWGQGQPSSLRAVTTTIRGVKLTLAAAICWENYMPLLRHSLYSQNVNLYLAPTADARDMWLSLMRTVACEGRCFVLSSNQCVRERDLPSWIHGETAEEEDLEEEDEEVRRRQFRRRSIVTESGHEIALPPEAKDDLEDAVLEEEEEKTEDRQHVRNASIVTEHGHEIVFPSVGEKQESQRAVNGGEDSSNRTVRTRKLSFVTEAGHEIALPSKGSEKFPARTISFLDKDMNGTKKERNESFVTSDGHEIICPSLIEDKSGKPTNGSSKKTTRTTIDSKNGPIGSSTFACRGGSCIISPTGEVLAGPLWEEEDGLLMVDVDFEDCLRGRLDLDVAGSYSRNDSFKLTVEGLDLSPPW